tara:strand:+ start:3859 stop:4134 length:276 start_codon:yes stop_codon:yes gene_type:complete
MSETKEKIFADGFGFKTRAEQPDWVVGRLAIKLEDAIPFLKTHAKNGWVNLNINTARSGNTYVELDTFVPNSNKTTEKVEEKAEVEENLPF